MAQKNENLVEKAKSNPQLFGRLYAKYASRIYKYFWYRSGFEKEISEDLTQETFLRAFRHLGSFKDKGASYISYLFKIAHNLLVNYYRSSKSIRLEDVGDVPVESNFEDKLEKEILWRRVQELRPMAQMVFLMRYKDNMKIKSIAEVTNKTENAVKLILFRARKKLNSIEKIII